VKKTNNRELLLIAPHTQAFIGDQLAIIKKHFDMVHVIIPFSFFSELVIRLPYLSERLRYFGATAYFRSLSDSVHSSGNEKLQVFPARFFALPIGSVEKRNFHLAYNACMKVVSKHSINFSLIHSHFLDIHSYIGAMIKEKYGKPLIITAHGSDIHTRPFASDRYYNLAKFTLGKADQVITVSKPNAGKLLSLGVPQSKIHIIPNGYDKKLFKPIPLGEARKGLGLPTSKKVILTVGSLVDVKGHAYLIHAMQTVLRKQSNVVLVIIGSGPSEKVLKKQAKNLGLNDNVLFTEMKKHEEIPIWMNACDLFVLPSLNEGFPTVIPEALACGKPIVATNVGGIPEIITKQDVGILVNPRSPRELSSAILDALEKKWNSKAILSYANRYSWDTLVIRIISLYEEMLSYQ
jgi:glycosyltransferase involved in cell wall biosynthesis